MQFTTKIPIPKSKNPINYSSKIILLGSCFAENIGEKFEYFKFQNTVNPFGIIFNPVSIEKMISRVVSNQKFTEEDVFFYNERWHCYEVHSEISHENKADLLDNLNKMQQSTNGQITEASHVIITFGTSWVYKLKSTEEIVANCHKVPQNQFEKLLLSVETIEDAIQNTINLIRKVNVNCNIIFTISPVRHIKDGFIQNQQSKAHLIVALHKTLKTEHSSLNTDYFPSYEIMMDELRDYRFYANDMLHPNTLAIEYIWERFFDSQMEETIFSIMEEVDTIQKSLLHKPFHPNSESHLKFLDQLNQKIDTLAKRLPHTSFNFYRDEMKT